MDIPYTSLSEEVLDSVLEEYITREGTEYGERDYSLEEKLTHLKIQLKLGQISITYDEETQSCSLTTNSQGR